MSSLLYMVIVIGYAAVILRTAIFAFSPGPPPPQAPTTEALHLAIARAAFLSESLSADEYEASVEHVLDAGRLGENGRVPAPAHARCDHEAVADLSRRHLERLRREQHS